MLQAHEYLLNSVTAIFLWSSNSLLIGLIWLGKYQSYWAIAYQMNYTLQNIYV